MKISIKNLYIIIPKEKLRSEPEQFIKVDQQELSKAMRDITREAFESKEPSAS